MIRDLGLLGLRATVGSYLTVHGAQKLWGAFDGPGLDKAGAGFERMGLTPGRTMAQVAGVSEVAGGVLTATGIAHPLGPVAVASTMTVAAASHRKNGPMSAKGGYELAATNLAAALLLATHGPGALRLGPSFGPKARWAVIAGGVAGTAGALYQLYLADRRSAASATEVQAAPPSASTTSAGSVGIEADHTADPVREPQVPVTA